MMKTILVLLCTVFALCIADHSELCSEQRQTEFIENSLSQECANGLANLRFRVPPLLNEDPATPFIFTPPSTDDLDAVCIDTCGGAYSRWLLETCEDPLTARSVEAMCIFTAGTTNIGPRCRFTFPDALNGRLIFLRVFASCDFGMSGFCTNGPSNISVDICLALTEVVDSYGCCYQSLFNDTDFVGYLNHKELLSGPMTDMLLNLGRSPIWEHCSIDVPPKCEPTRIIASSASSIMHCAAVSFSFSLVIILPLLVAILFGL